MAYPQEHHYGVVRVYGAVYGFPGKMCFTLTIRTLLNSYHFEYAPQGTANLQSSINAKDGLGTVSLSAIYAALVVSCIFLPTLVIRKLTAKWTLCVSMLCYAPYIAAQFYPTFYTLVPAGILAGLGAAPMWASKATYLTQLGQVYAKLTEQSVEAIIVRFFGFFFLAWQTAELWGNLISSLGWFKLKTRIDRR